jgi:putative membrane protein
MRDEGGTAAGPDRRGGRWPRSVYEVGTEPDPRFTLANERTFLAWVRTTVALLAGAAALDALELALDDRVRRGLAMLLAIGGLACVLMAWRGWSRTERALRRGEPLPHSPAQLVLVVTLVLVAIVIAVAQVVSDG